MRKSRRTYRQSGQLDKTYAYNESIGENSAYYRVYRDWLVKLAMMRYKWLNLPDTCDQRALEYALAMGGQATISYNPETPGVWISTGAVFSGKFDVYGDPVKWRTFTPYTNDWQFYATPATGVYIWDSTSRTNPWPAYHAFALELTRVKMARITNRLVQNVPFVITCDRNAKVEAENMMLSLFSGQPAIGKFSNSSVEIETIPVDVEYKADAFETDFQNCFNEFLNFAGIRSLPRKMERMIEEEVTAQEESTMLAKMDGLSARRKAAEEFNERFGGDVHVIYNTEVESEVLKMLAEGGVNE